MDHSCYYRDRQSWLNYLFSLQEVVHLSDLNKVNCSVRHIWGAHVNVLLIVITRDHHSITLADNGGVAVHCRCMSVNFQWVECHAFIVGWMSYICDELDVIHLWWTECHTFTMNWMSYIFNDWTSYIYDKWNVIHLQLS